MTGMNLLGNTFPFVPCALLHFLRYLKVQLRFLNGSKTYTADKLYFLCHWMTPCSYTCFRFTINIRCLLTSYHFQALNIYLVGTKTYRKKDPLFTKECLICSMLPPVRMGEMCACKTSGLCSHCISFPDIKMKLGRFRFIILILSYLPSS